MFNEIAFRIIGFFMTVGMIVTLIQFVASLRNYKTIFGEMEKLARKKNIHIANKSRTLSSLSEIHKAIHSNESEALFRKAGVVVTVVKLRFRIFIIISIFLALLLTL